MADLTSSQQMWPQVAMVQMTKTLQRRRFTQQCFQAGTGVWPRTSMLQVLVRNFLSLWMVSFFFFLSLPMFLLLCHTYIVWKFDALPISSCFKHIFGATGKTLLDLVRSVSLEAPPYIASRIDSCLHSYLICGLPSWHVVSQGIIPLWRELPAFIKVA